MKRKKLIAGMLAVLTMGQALAVATPTITAAVTRQSTNSIFNEKGLWLTEIYQNDVDRSQEKNTREANGYESIDLYEDTTDLMEFIEITSTYDTSINLNDMYEIYYGDELLSVTDMEGNSNIVIEPNQSVVLWNYRSDLSTAIPTEAEFRKNMRIPDDAVVLKVTSGENWSTTATFSLRTKADGNTISTFTATDKVDTMDGFSVELKIPDIGSEMQVYREMTTPSAGYVYSGQLNGLVNANVPEETYANGVYITEIRPNDTNRKADYTTESDLMECVEITNTTDKDVDLNNEYQLQYFVKEGTRKVLPLHKYDETADTHIGSSENCIVPTGGTAVIWCFREATLNDYSIFPTEADFREAYGIEENVPVYIFTNQDGLNNTNRGFELYKIEDDGTKNLVSNYCYAGNSDCKDNKSVDLMVNPEGPEMLVSTANAATSMGTVKEAQYTYLQDDGSAMTLELDDEIPESIMQGEEIRVNFYFEASETLPRTGITTYYRFDGEGTWYSSTEVNRRVPNLYELKISADELFNHDYVEFYVSADNRYRSTLSDIYKVNINKLNDVDGIRTNISEGEEVSGTISVTANDGGDNANSEIYIDGEKCSSVAMLEDGAYFTFHADGRDSYFKNAITTTENEWITAIGKWQYTILDGQAVHIDNSYFTYNEETNAYDVTLRIWAGTYGTTVDEYLLPDANREDFTVTQLALRLINGKVYYPTVIGPDEEATSKKTNLSTEYSAVHSIGDSTGMCPYMDVSFTVPASEVTGVGTEIDTLNLADGEHTLKVTNGTSTKEVKFIVDNSKPEITTGIEDGSELTGKITIDPQVTETNTLDELVVLLDETEIITPYETTAYELGKGEHTLSVFAKDAAGNENDVAVTFNVSDVSMAVTDAGATDITDSSASLYLTLQNSTADTQATFYKAEKVDTSRISTETTSGILPYIQYTINVGDVKNDDVILANWDGTASNADNTHASTMYVLNTVTGGWDEIASTDENGSIAQASFVAENHVENGTATVIVQCTADSALPDVDTTTDGLLNTNENWDGNTVPEDYDFCFAWETDTQYYAEEWQYHFLNMNNWIVDNADEMKIKYVIHTGDIVDDHDMIYQWENADEAMKIFDDAGMPYGVLGGNHDVAAGLEEYDNYYTYFSEDRFTSQPTYGGSYRNNLGHYDLISENGQDFIILYMSWNIYQEEIDWMNEVLAQYSDRKAILCFHPYTNVKQSNGTYLDYFGELIQRDVVAKNENVFAVLNGHYHGSSYETAMFDDNGDGVNDRTVYQICTDYQSGFEGGSEYIKFLYFDLDNNKIYMNSYSPYLDDYNYFDTDEVHNLNVEGASATEVDKMTLDVEFNTNEQSILANQFSAYVCTNEEIGTATADANSGKVSVSASGLTAETEYLWYAEITNENTGYLKSGVYEFTTAQKSADSEPTTTEPTTSTEPATSEPTEGTEPTTTEPAEGTEPTTTEPTEGTEPTTTEPTEGTEPTTTEPTEGTETTTSTEPSTSVGSTSSTDATSKVGTDATSATNSNSSNNGSQSNTGSVTSTSNTSTVKTGDTFSAIALAIVLLTAATLGGIAVFKKKKNEA